jgi:dGTPase
VSTKSLYPESHLSRRTKTSTTSDYRTPFRRDYARLVHSAAVRRLGGKTQLFPTNENAKFRTRLTHSMEVAQIAKSIAIKLNNTVEEYRSTPIDTDLVEFAALGHDIGHPPFGHNGEEVLNQLLPSSGGFEGNAQSLRIIARTEPKETDHTVSGVPHPIGPADRDARVGINATARSLAAILKYPRRIPIKAKERGGKDNIYKGYYAVDQDIFDFILTNVFQDRQELADLRTIECNIMDLSDDIAYSTYDVEDAFVAGLLDPASIMGAPESILEAVAAKVRQRCNKIYDEECDVDARRVLTILKRIFDQVIWGDGAPPTSMEDEDIFESQHRKIPLASSLIREGDYIRTRLTAFRVGALVDSIELVQPDAAKGNPIYFDIRLPKPRYLEMEVLKNLVFETLIKAPDFQMAKYRGMKIVRDLYAAMTGEDGELLLPRDVQDLYRTWREDDNRADRVICDFISSLTDEYATDLHKRMHGWDAMAVRGTR